MADIAVAVTTYNQANWIGQTLESVLAQSLPPKEVVVIDDGSTDDTPAVLDRFRDRVRVIRQRNTGVAGSRNAAVLACSADYVALMDGDDLWHRDKLRRSAELLAASGEPSLLVHDLERISPKGDVIGGGEIAARLSTWGNGPVAVVNCVEHLILDNFISTTSQVVVRRTAYIDAGLSNPAFPIASDYDLYLRLATRGPFVFSGDVLTQWRRHEKSASGPAPEKQLDSVIDMATVLHMARTRADMASYIGTIDLRQRTLVRLTYSSEERCGKKATVRALARLAWRTRSAQGAIAAGAILLTPQRLRRLLASVTSVSISTQPEH